MCNSYKVNIDIYLILRYDPFIYFSLVIIALSSCDSSDEQAGQQPQINGNIIPLEAEGKIIVLNEEVLIIEFSLSFGKVNADVQLSYRKVK